MSFYDNILGVLPPAIGADDAPSDDRAPLQTSAAAFLARWPADVAPGEDAGDRRSLPSTFYDNILGRPFLGTASPPPVPKDRAPDRPPAPAVAAAPLDPAANPDHDTILDDTLRAAYVPPHQLDPGHLVGAANLMAKEGLDPADAYERVALQSARACGLCDPELQDVYGLGGGDAPPASAPPDETPEPRDLKRWPASQAPTNEGRETGPSDSGAPFFDPAVMLAASGSRRPGGGPGRVPDMPGPFFPPPQQPAPPQQPPQQPQPPQQLPKQPQPPSQQLPPQQSPQQPPPQPPPPSTRQLLLPLPPRPGTGTPPSPPLDHSTPADVGFDTANIQDKLHGYLLDPDHGQNQGKAIWFQKALGFDKNTWQQLAPQLYFDESTAVFRETTPYGDRYSQFIPVTGPNGRTIAVEFIFQKDGAGRVTFITGIPTDK